MELITCANGHTYDPSISPNCPQCAGHTVPLAEPSFFGDDIGKTVPLRRDTVPVTPPVPVQWADPGVSYGPAASASKNEAVTMPVNYDQGGISEKAELPVTGWLVCVDGPEKGRDYRLHEEYNYIGRSSSMDVSIPGDPTISREKHAIIAYDTQERVFYFAPATGASIVRQNGKAVLNNVELKAWDKLQIGKCTFMFVPLCGEAFQWS